MLRLIWRLCRFLVVVLVLGLGFYLGSPYLFAAIGRYLITEQPMAKADIILVLSGGPYLRIPEAARVFHEGIAPAILLTRGPQERGTDDLMRVGIRILDEQENSVKLLEDLRVPRKAILTLQERSDGTRAEMQTVARFLREHPARTVVIVTSKAHTSRAYKIFSTGLGSGIRLIMRPAGNDPFDPSRWWHNRTDTW
ncbi:MAG TPA: YdcF family protein, partial [Candidatus Acidoferrum sp.]|nr:YdcF family protein [Candidatus Acidoferrum sp.]